MVDVVFVVHETRDQARDLSMKACVAVEERGLVAKVVFVGPRDGERDRQVESDLSAEVIEGAKLVVSLGGDGTFLRVVPFAYASDIPILGVNFGRLGYLLEVEPKELLDVLSESLSGALPIEERAVMEITIEGSIVSAAGMGKLGPKELEESSGKSRREIPRRWIALNEVAIEKGVPGHMVQLATAIDGSEGLTYHADGVLISTPTGSTGYNLSAGGPVCSPQLRALILTPVAPHLTVDRSLVLGEHQRATVKVLPPRTAVVVIDGQVVGYLAPGTSVECCVASKGVKIIGAGKRGFAQGLRRIISTDFSSQTSPNNAE